MSSRTWDLRPAPADDQRLGWPTTTLLAAAAFLMALAVAGLVALGLWYLAAVLLVAGPAFYLLNRYPLTALILWLVLDPILMVGDVGAGRRVYWLIHRALPVGTLLVLFLARLIGVRKLKFPKLGWPEAMMGGFIILTVLSVAYRSADPVTTYIYMYDHVVIPMSIYLLVRLLAPDEEDFRRFVPVLVFFVLSQSLFGILGWVAPGALPAGWINREERATGTLRHPNVYATALLFAGLYLAHYGQTQRHRRGIRRLTSLLMFLTVVMAVVTLSRASWLAALVVVIGLLFVYPRLSQKLMLAGATLVLVAAMVGGVVGATQQILADRLSSEQSTQTALSRLPVIVASLRMIEARPLIGWGYENFDVYDHAFTGSIQGVYVPDKDHASHNMFLTLGAEGGLIGLLLYLGPAIWWLAKSRSGLRNLPDEGFRSKKMVWMLWLALAAQITAYNFSNNRVAFGLGVWWLTLGLIATACDWRDRAIGEATTDVRDRIDAMANHDQVALDVTDS